MYKDHVVLFSQHLKELLGMEGDFVHVYVEPHGGYVHVVTSSLEEFKNSRKIYDGAYIEERSLPPVVRYG